MTRRARSLARLAATIIAASLSGCTATPHVDVCKHAALRRTVYATTIAAADAYLRSGRATPPEVLIGREVAVTALAVLDGRCPQTIAYQSGP